MDLVEPGATLGIILGASEFPKSPSLGGGAAFLASATDFGAFLKASRGFGLPKENVLNLFDARQSPDDIDASIAEFLVSRQMQLSNFGTPARDLIVFYVGHGDFTPGDQKYFLAVRTTRQGSPGPSSIRMTDLASTLMQHAKNVRRYLILDCCFAAAAFQEFQGTGVGAATRRKTLAEFPQRGTALLCACSSRDVALAPKGHTQTMFSGALLTVLTGGIPGGDSRLSLEEVGERVVDLIKTTYPGAGAARPEVSSPDQREGRVAAIPLFPNLALRSRRLETPAKDRAAKVGVTRTSRNSPPAAAGRSKDRAASDDTTEAVANSVIEYLAQKPILYDEMHIEDRTPYIESVTLIDAFLESRSTMRSSVGDLREILASMRIECNYFLKKAGLADPLRIANRTYVGGPFPMQFLGLVGEFRGRMGALIVQLAGRYGIRVREPLARALPSPESPERSPTGEVRLIGLPDEARIVSGEQSDPNRWFAKYKWQVSEADADFEIARATLAPGWLQKPIEGTVTRESSHVWVASFPIFLRLGRGRRELRPPMLRGTVTLIDSRNNKHRHSVTWSGWMGA